MAHVATTQAARAVSPTGQPTLSQALVNLAQAFVAAAQAHQEHLQAQQNLHAALAPPTQHHLRRTDGFETAPRRHHAAPAPAPAPRTAPRATVERAPLDLETPLSRPVTLSYGAHARHLAPQEELRVKRLLDRAGVDHALITSTSRTPHDQARIMLDNIRSKGLQSQYDLYGKAGDSVIKLVELFQGALPDDALVDLMAGQISKVGPHHVSHHCAEAGRLVVDIAPSSIPNRRAFVDCVEQARREGAVSEFLHPGNSTDPAFHVEFPKR